MYQIPSKFEIIKSPKLAIRVFKKLRWQGELACPHCGCLNDIKTHSLLPSGLKRYFCENCNKTFSDSKGTIFAKSKIPIWKWLYVLIILFESTGSVSSAEVSRSIEVNYKTAFKMMRKIRNSLFLKRFAGNLQGVVESDEAWISRKTNQTILLGMVERRGGLKLFPILDRSEVSIYFPHRRYVEKGSMVCSDSHSSYNSLNSFYDHYSVNHSKGEFAWKAVHTNTIEGVWSMLKGILRTIHHGVWKDYLMSYCDLFVFMYSHRHLSFSNKFNLLFSSLCQPRSCTY